MKCFSITWQVSTSNVEGLIAHVHHNLTVLASDGDPSLCGAKACNELVEGRCLLALSQDLVDATQLLLLRDEI